ncbi:hypothetical protein SSP35_11_01520 [Streptomyces sp. NBRC 110611]|uniref:DUF6343 family protein n=1 Tax=Streptomyces sp. NBRC 110611 TaxID=1621259 RepID=UPI000833E38E|nr:DUF6343 family protein [Streptomyces sp. NBRC 110611]GAU69333.1 hypothetical protein SSP35_11_01520 [Streptomyces sp. NBRC 110611]
MKRSRTGTEPVTARSALRLRLILASGALVVFATGTIRFASWARASQPNDSPGPTVLLALSVVCGVLALVAALDLVVILRRCRREQRPGG